MLERYRGLAEFRSALRQFVAASENICWAAGVTTQQYQVLLAIGCGPDLMSMKDLAEQLLLQPHAAVQLVNRLEKLGLVLRRPSERDRRSVIVELTPEGLDRLRSLADRHLSEMLRREPLLSSALNKLREQGA